MKVTDAIAGAIKKSLYVGFINYRIFEPKRIFGRCFLHSYKMQRKETKSYSALREVPGIIPNDSSIVSMRVRSAGKIMFVPGFANKLRRSRNCSLKRI